MRVKSNHHSAIHNDHKIKSCKVTALPHGNRQILLCLEKNNLCIKKMRLTETQWLIGKRRLALKGLEHLLQL